jgi:hypothetical protein
MNETELRRWLGERAPEQLPIDLRAGVLAIPGRAPRVWPTLGSWRITTATIAIGLAVVVAGTLLLRGSAQIGPGPSPSASASVNPTKTSTPSLSPTPLIVAISSPGVTAEATPPVTFPALPPPAIPIDWTAFVSPIYGYTAGHPSGWSVRSATHAAFLGEPSLGPTSTAFDYFYDPAKLVPDQYHFPGPGAIIVGAGQLLSGPIGNGPATVPPSAQTLPYWWHILEPCPNDVPSTTEYDVMVDGEPAWLIRCTLEFGSKLAYAGFVHDGKFWGAVASVDAHDPSYARLREFLATFTFGDYRASSHSLTGPFAGSCDMRDQSVRAKPRLAYRP